MDGGLCFRDIECFNQALLAKTVWRIVMQPDSLANRVLQAKYVHGGDWAATPIGPKPSFIWRSLVWEKEVLCAGIRWCVDNGTAIRIWEDKWLPSPWSFRVVTPRFMDSNTRVSTLMMSPGMWNVNFIQTHFLPVDEDKILSIPVCEKSGNDVAIWHYTNDRYYTVKSSYWLAMELRQIGKSTSSSGEKDETNSNSIWSIIWGLSVPNKVKLFLWRACHAFLPCVERLFKRKVCYSDICGRCGGTSESVLHSLWDCRIAQKVWKCTWLAGVVKLWKFQSFSDLLHRVAMECANKELEFFGLVCWWIWKCRNDTMHGKEGLKPDILVHRCKEWQSELAQTQSTNKQITGFDVKEVVRTPHVSNTSSSLLYFDGAVDKLIGRVGVGAVVLNPECGLLGALSVPLPLSLNPKATEALALWYGIEYAKKLGVSNVDIRGDALNVFNGLKTCGWDFSEIGGVFDAVRLIMTDFEIVLWRHVKKRFIAVAHELARRVLSLAEGWFCQEQGPEWLLQLIVGSNV